MTRTVFGVAAAVGVAWACSSGNSGPAGGAVVGTADTHCTLGDGGLVVQATSQASCMSGGGDAGALDLGPTMFNAEGDDDDCKYHVKFSSTPVYEHTDVTFTVTATNKGDGGPATGANIDPEVFLSSTHPAPNSNVKTTESAPGTYQVGPIQFDLAGRWTVRFHLYENCEDVLPDSPHGHAAFYVDVP
jgi:YtkA-like